MTEGGGTTHDATSGLRADPVAGTRREGGAIVVILAGELDLYNANDVRAALLAACAEAPERLIVDVAGVTFIDSTALGVLIEARSRMTERKAFIIAAPGMETKRALEISGLDRHFTVHESVEQAIAADL